MSFKKIRGFNEAEFVAGHPEVEWDGSLDMKELLAQKTKAAPLFAALLNRARQLKHPLEDLCCRLDITYPYFLQLRDGRRQLALESEFLKISRAYLGIPRLTVLALAGLIVESDFEVEPNEVLSSLPRAFSFLSEDPKWGHLMDPKVFETPYEVRYLIVRLYEDATGNRILPEKIDAGLLGEALKELNREVESLVGATSSTKKYDSDIYD